MGAAAADGDEAGQRERRGRRGGRRLHNCGNRRWSRGRSRCRGGDGRRRRLAKFVVAPADRQAVGAEGAGVVDATADCGERAQGRRCLAVLVVTPADRGAVGAEGACVKVSAADGGKARAGVGQRLAKLVVAPADRGAVGSEGAGVAEAAADGGEPLPGGGRRLADIVTAPADRGAVSVERARVNVTAADGGEYSHQREGDAWPFPSSPQQTGEPSARRAQV